MKIDIKKLEDVTVVYLSGDIKSTTSGEVMDKLVEVVQGGTVKMLININEVDFISSAGLRSLLVASKLLQKSNGQMKICNANDSVKRILETSGFTNLISLYPDENEALNAFS